MNASTPPSNISFPQQLQHYINQMLVPDNAVKHEVMRHLCESALTVIGMWERNIVSNNAAHRQKVGNVTRGTAQSPIKMFLVTKGGVPYCARATRHEADCYASGFSYRDSLEVTPGIFTPDNPNENLG